MVFTVVRYYSTNLVNYAEYRTWYVIYVRGGGYVECTTPQLSAILYFLIFSRCCLMMHLEFTMEIIL